MLRAYERDSSLRVGSGRSILLEKTARPSRQMSGPDGICTFVLFFLLPAICCLLLSGFACTPQKERMFRKTKTIMDTMVTITVVTDTPSGADEVIARAFQEIERLEKAANRYSQNSEIAKINSHAGLTPVTVSPDIIELLIKAQQVSEKTDGAFDITIGPIVSLYDFRNQRTPSPDMIKRSLTLVNYRNMIIDRERSTVFLKKKGMLIDPGGIMKGYAADRAAEILQINGVHSGIVAVGGDIRPFGLRADGTQWRVGIRHPRAIDQDDVIGVIELSNLSISTSGDYERFFMQDANRIHHLLSPQTGYPSIGCRSVSVISADGALADAYSTGIFILGRELGMKTLEQNGLEGVIVDDEGILHATPGIKGRLELKNPL